MARVTQKTLDFGGPKKPMNASTLKLRDGLPEAEGTASGRAIPNPKNQLTLAEYGGIAPMVGLRGVTWDVIGGCIKSLNGNRPNGPKLRGLKPNWN